MDVLPDSTAEIPLEIERRFLLKRLPAEPANKVYSIYQKYSDNGWRYRQTSDDDGRTSYYKTWKNAIAPGVNEEEEYEITGEEYHEECGKPLRFIEKTRYVYTANGLDFEVDAYPAISLTIMEVELASITQQFEMPRFLNDLIIFEVTGISQFSNSSLADACD